MNGEKTTRGKEVSFDILVANGQQKVSVNLNVDGKIQKKTVITPKKSKAAEEAKEEGEKEDWLHRRDVSSVWPGSSSG